MAEKPDDRPFWGPELMTELLDTMEKHGVDSNNLQEIWLILGCLMAATLQSAVRLGTSLDHIDALLDELVAKQKGLARDPSILPLVRVIEL